MAFDFPNSPAVGQQFTPVPGVTYSYNGYGWALLAPSPATGGGNLVFLGTQTASNSAALIFTGIDGSYDEYMFVGENLVPVSGSNDFQLQVSEDNGSTWKTTAGNYRWTGQTNNDGGTNAWPSATSAAGVSLTGAGANVSTIVANGFSFQCAMTLPASTTINKQFRSEGAYQGASNGHNATRTMGVYVATTNAINAVRFLANTGNIAQGKVSLYGVAKVPPTGTGALVMIQRQDIASAVATVDFTSGIGATYDEYELHFYGVVFAANGSLSLRISQDGGATWKAGATDYTYQNVYIPNPSSSGGFVAASAPAIVLGSHTAAVGNGAAGSAKFFLPTNTTQRKPFLTEMFVIGANFASYRGSGTYTTDNNAFNALRVFNDGGNINSGSFVLYGRVK